jgi:uncharacterized protein YecE (DUF72 family)
LVYIETSGWNYQHWRDRFYPEEVKKRRWLQHYAERFRTVEINNTFYNLPEQKTFRKWKEATPEGFYLLGEGEPLYNAHEKAEGH